MAATGSHRRRTVAAGLAVVLVCAGCGRDGDDPDDPELPATTPPPPLSTATPLAQEVGAPEFPETPQEYAEATVAAWAAPDLIRLSELATAELHDALVELPGPPDPAWTFIRCAVNVRDGKTADPASSDCAFYNTDGDYLVLTVGHRGLGGPQAALTMAFDATEYPDADAVAYLEAFVAAWLDGNRARMAALAVPDVVDVYTDLAVDTVRSPPATDVEYERVGSREAGVEVRVMVAGTAVRTRVSCSLLGAPQAIRSASVDDPTREG